MAWIKKGLIINERFEVQEILGTGGSGSVWRGNDQKLQRPVAIKRILNASLDPARRDEAVQEARTISTIADPHIVQIFDVVEYEDELLIVMEFLPQGTLHDHLRDLSQQERWVTASESFSILKGILTGLAAAHGSDRGEIIHRDLKPENILFDAAMKPKIADFGLASVGTVERIKTADKHGGGHTGTYGYMAPEQVQGETLDVRTDLFNVGMIAYLLFGAIHPFIDPRNLFNFNEMLLKPYRDLPPIESSALPPEVEEFVFTLLDDDPESRFPSAISALDELEHAERKYNEKFLERVLEFHDSLKTSAPVKDSFCSEELTLGIQLCKRNQFYAQGAYLFENSGIDFGDVRDDVRNQVENDYQFCRRRAQQEVSG